jgi:predicted acyl esterase
MRRLNLIWTLAVLATTVALVMAGGPAAVARKGGVPNGKGLGLEGAPGQQADGGGEEDADEPPANFIETRSDLSQPAYPVTKKTTETFTTFDGEKLYLEITKPDPAVYGDGPWPVILEASPYHGTIATRIGDRIFSDPKTAQGQMLGLTGYFAPRGYAVVMMDLRGTGRSTGCLDHLGPNDAKDLKLVIEYLAGQPWSNGRVGMTGHSYVGSTPIVAAAMRPEGLVTIAPSAGLASMYDHMFQKGVPYSLQWIGPMVAYEWLGIYRDLPAGVPAPPVLGGGASGDNYTANGPNPQFGCGMQNSANTGTGQLTGQYDQWHAKRDWRERAAEADIPIFMIHGVNDNAARIPAAEWFFAERFNRPGDKIWLGQNDHGSGGSASAPGPTRCQPAGRVAIGHPNCRFDQWKYALHAWFDKHLMQRDVDTGPPVEVFLNGETPLETATNGNYDPFGNPGKVYTNDQWSRPDVRDQLYLDATNRTLSLERPAANGSAAFTSQANAVIAWTNPIANVTFSGQPLEEDTLFLGLPRLDLHASVSNPGINHLTATLFRVDDDGNREAMNFCAIQPQLRDGVHTLSPVVPGQEMALPMQCFTMAHWVPAGQHLELEIATRTQHHASFGNDPQITVFTGPQKSNYLLPRVTDFTLFDDVPLREGA